MAVIGSLSNLRPGERIVSRLLLRSLGPGWSQGYLQQVHQQPVAQGQSLTDPRQGQNQGGRPEGAGLVILGALALIGLKGYQWVQQGEMVKAVLLGIGSALGLAVAGWAWSKWQQGRNRVNDPLLVKEKVNRVAFAGELQVVAILPAESVPHRAGELLEPVAAAYRHYDHPAVARFRVGKVQPAQATASLQPAAPGFFGKRNVLCSREMAALWHPPGDDYLPLVERSSAKSLPPPARSVAEGAPVGEATAGGQRDVRFSPDLLRRHHLYVARTRMGKSTLMSHVIAHKLKEKAESRDGDAIVVIDPHADLVAGLLEQVPDGLADRVKLIDLADQRGAPGINLLDTRIFADRDRTADSVVRVMHGLWDQWGPRMQSILEHTVKSLHEANGQVERDRQYTILDGLRLVAEPRFRRDVLGKVNDPYLLRFWARDFLGWNRERRGEAIAPVQTRLAYYASWKKARSILGQSRSTIDLRETILGGGILLVSTAQGSVGRDVAALVGASLLNLVDAVIREQESLPLERRRGALVLVDEMQSLPGVDYEVMLSELGKYGASFILATQSLAKLDDLSRTMRDTILANMGCLAVFQVSGSDARQLVWELGKDRVSEDDITSLPVHHCYVRATVGTERLPAYSMMVKKPELGDPAVAARIRVGAAAYLQPADAGDAEGRRQVGEYRKLLSERQGEADSPSAAQVPGAVSETGEQERVAEYRRLLAALENEE